MDNIKLDIKKDADNNTPLENENEESSNEEQNDEKLKKIMIRIVVRTGKKKGAPSTFGELASSYDAGHIIVDDDNVEWIVNESKNKIKVEEKI